MDYGQSTYAAPAQERNLLRLVNLAIVALVIADLAVIFLIIAGYGTVKLEHVPSNATISLNGHQLTSDTLRLRPGSYQLVISSPTAAPTQQAVTVSLFRTTNYTPSLQQRQPDAIASSVIGALSGSTQAPHLIDIKWFANNTWLVALAMPGSAPLALHYDAAHQWSVGFYQADGYPNDTAGLPADIAAYIKQLEVQNAASTH